MCRYYMPESRQLLDRLLEAEEAARPAYASSPRIIPAHCSELIAPVPESVRRSISTLADASRKRLYPAFLSKAARSSREVMRIGSTVLILNGSMIVLKQSGVLMWVPARAARYRFRSSRSPIRSRKSLTVTSATR